MKQNNANDDWSAIRRANHVLIEIFVGPTDSEDRGIFPAKYSQMKIPAHK